MSLNLLNISYFAAMVVTIVVIDMLFLRHSFLARLLVNIGIVLVFVITYLLLFTRA